MSQVEGAEFVAKWIGRLESENEPPPTWRLVPPEEYASSIRRDLARDLASFDRVFIDEATGYLDLSTSVHPRVSLSQIVEYVDPGRTIRAEETEASADIQWWSTFIDGTPVVGAGGRIEWRTFGDSTRLSISVRRRERPIPAVWRRQNEIVDRLSAYIDRWSGRVHHVAAGYYEAGNGIRQLTMAIAMVAIIENDEATNEGPWRSVIVEPLTETLSADRFFAVEAVRQPDTISDVGTDGIMDALE